MGNSVSGDDEDQRTDTGDTAEENLAERAAAYDRRHARWGHLRAAAEERRHEEELRLARNRFAVGRTKW